MALIPALQSNAMAMSGMAPSTTSMTWRVSVNLERAGWTFVRVRESDFYADREGAIKTVTDVCEELGINSLDHVEEPTERPSVCTAAVQVDADARSSEMTTHSSTAGEDQIVEADVLTSEYGPFSGYSDMSGFPDPREASPPMFRPSFGR